MDAYTPVVTKVTHEQQFDSGGKPTEVYRVEYKVGQHGPFIERIARAEFNAAKVQQIMNATAATLQQLGATSQQ